MTISMFDQILIDLTCESPKCLQQFQETIGQLTGKDRLPCPKCGNPINLKTDPLRRAIKKQIDTASELDKQARARGELIERIK